MDKPYAMISFIFSSSSFNFLISICACRILYFFHSAVHHILAQPGDTENAICVRWLLQFLLRFVLCARAARTANKNSREMNENLYLAQRFVLFCGSVNMCACDRRTMTSQSIRSCHTIYSYLFLNWPMHWTKWTGRGESNEMKHSDERFVCYVIRIWPKSIDNIFHVSKNVRRWSSLLIRCNVLWPFIATHLTASQRTRTRGK